MGEDYAIPVLYGTMAMAPSRDYAQRQREEHRGLGGGRSIKKVSEKVSAKVKAGPRWATLGDVEHLDRAMASMMDTKSIHVVKREDPIHLCATYSFYDLDTDAKYDHVEDQHGARTFEELVQSRKQMMHQAQMALVEQKLKQELLERKKLEKVRYTDVEGRVFHKTFPPPVTAKATIHKEGHFPTQWMEEAIDRAEASEKCVTISVERKGVMVVAMEGDDRYASHVITWQAMEKAEVNPLPLAIEDVERKLDLLHKMKAKVA